MELHTCNYKRINELYGYINSKGIKSLALILITRESDVASKCTIVILCLKVPCNLISIDLNFTHFYEMAMFQFA